MDNIMDIVRQDSMGLYQAHFRTTNIEKPLIYPINV